MSSLIVPRESDPVIYCAPPPDAPFPHAENLLHPVFGPAEDVWPRRSPEGLVIGGQARWRDKDKEKQDRQFRWARLNGHQGWTLKAGPYPWPLFGLDELAEKPDAPVLVVEGPKTREAARSLFPGWALISSCGAQAVKQFDWTPLYGRKVVIWPDADIPGLRYASAVCEMLGLIMDLNVVHVPLGAVEGWDLADPVPSGWDIEDLLSTASPGFVSPRATAEVSDEEPDLDGERRSLYLPDSFWESRDSLKRTRDWCRCRRFPLDSTFVAAMTRISSMLAPVNKLDTGLGSPAPPILFAMIVADSGGGKTIAATGAKILIPKVDGMMFIDGAQPGSGEGIEGAFCRKKSDGGEWEQIRNNAWFCVDEGEVIQQIKRRNGATIGAKLRQLWTGGDLVTQLAGTVRSAKDYTCGLVMAMQFSVLIEILSDSEANLGTPGRFLWVHAGDPNLGRAAADTFSPRLFWTPPGEIAMHRDVLREIDDSYCRRMRGDEVVESIDAHRNYLKARVAAIFAVMDQRDFVTPEDWALAEVMMQTSDRVRTKCMSEAAVVEGSHFQQELDRHVIKARVQKAAMDSGYNPEWHMGAAVARRCQRMWSKGKPMTIREAAMTLKGSATMVSTAIAYAENQGWIEKVPSTRGWRPGVNPVPARPDSDR